jgi:hypothetical protein
VTKKINVFRELMTENLTPTISEFIDEYLPVTVRDLSVQREEVWDALKQRGYISTAIVGTGKFTPIHICSLGHLLEVAHELRDISFIKRLENFIQEGYKYAHLDGGNRCDCFLAFFDGTIKCSEGDYRFLAQFDEDGEMVKDTYNEYVEAPMTFAELKAAHPKIVERLNNQYLILFIYKDLTSEERANVFKMLNDGVNLNAAEDRNPSQEFICTDIRDEMNIKFKPLMIASGMITEEKSKRFGSCELIAKYATVYADKVDIPTVGGKTELDVAYSQNSIVGNEYSKFKTFFTTKFVPYLKIIAKEEYHFASPNFFFDLFLILKNMDNSGIKLPVINNDARDTLLKKVAELQIIKMAETIQYEQKAGTKSTYEGLFSKNSNMVTKHRFKIVNDYYIPALIESEIVVKTDEDRFYSKTQKAQLFMKSSITSNNVSINPGHVFNAKKIQADHKDAHSKGHPTELDNGKLEEAAYNNAKGAT